MSLNVSHVNSVYSSVYSGGYKYNPEKFVQNAYAVKGDLYHPESRVNSPFNPEENRGLGVYYLA